MCDTKMSDSKENKICEDQYGAWIRASLPRGMRKGGIGVSETRKKLGVSSELKNGEKVVGEGSVGGNLNKRLSENWELRGIRKNEDQGIIAVGVVLRDNNQVREGDNAVRKKTDEAEGENAEDKIQEASVSKNEEVMFRWKDDRLNKGYVRELMDIEKDSYCGIQTKGILREVD